MKIEITSLIDAMVIAKHQLGIKIEGRLSKVMNGLFPIKKEKEMMITNHKEFILKVIKV